MQNIYKNPLNITTRRFCKENRNINIKKEEGSRFIIDCLEAVGTPKQHAKIISKSLISSDYRGCKGQGLNRLNMYVNEILSKSCDPKAKPEIINENDSTIQVDGRHGLGAVAASFCNDLAIKKAKLWGVGVVICKDSNHFGAASFYSHNAMEQGLIGICATNGPRLVCPTRSKMKVISSNPLSLCAPAEGNDFFLLDMATSGTSWGAVELLRRYKKSLPVGLARDKEGNSTNNPFEATILEPLGGFEETKGYKGYGLATAVEMLTGVLSEGELGPNLKEFGDFKSKSLFGHCFIVINPEFFAPDFRKRLSELLEYLRSLKPFDNCKRVLVCGDIEKDHMKMVDEIGGIPYVASLIDDCNKLADDLKVDRLKLLC